MVHHLHIPLVYAASFRARHHQSPIDLGVAEDQVVAVESVEEHLYPVVMTLRSETGLLRWRQRLSDGLLLREVALPAALAPAPVAAFTEPQPANNLHVIAAGGSGWVDHPAALNTWQDPFRTRTTSAATRAEVEAGNALKWLPKYRFWKWIDTAQRSLREEALHQACQDMGICGGALLKPAAEPVIIVEAAGIEVRVRRVAPPLLDHLGTVCSFFRADEEEEAIECAHLLALDREVFAQEAEVKIDDRRISFENGYSLRDPASRHLALLAAVQDHRTVLGASTPHDAMAFGLAFDALSNPTESERTDYALARLAQIRGRDLKNFSPAVGAIERAAVQARQNILEKRTDAEFAEMPAGILDRSGFPSPLA